MYALIINDAVHELFDERPVLAAGLEVVDVSAISGIETGWVRSGSTFVAPPTITPPEPVIPASVSAAQARIALSRADKLDAVKAAVTAAGGEVEIWFDYATAWERQNQHVLDLGSGIGLTSEQIDGLFTEAATIAA